MVCSRSGAQASGAYKTVQPGMARAGGFLLLGVLAGCSSTSSMNPVNWWHGLQGGRIAEERPAPPGAEAPYPNLSTVPARPAPPDRDAMKRLTESLIGDRSNAQYTAEAAPLADPSSPSASPGLFGAGTLPPPPPAPPPGSAAAGSSSGPLSASLPAASAPPPPGRAAEPGAVAPGAEPAAGSADAAGARAAGRTGLVVPGSRDAARRGVGRVRARRGPGRILRASVFAAGIFNSGRRHALAGAADGAAAPRRRRAATSAARATALAGVPSRPRRRDPGLRARLVAIVADRGR